MKRPILVAVIGYVIGIIMGLYFNFSIALLYAFLFLITIFIKVLRKIKFIINNQFYHIKSKRNNYQRKNKFSIFKISRYFRYIKLIFNHKLLITIILFSILSNTIVILKNKEYDSLYKGIEEVEMTAIIVGGKTEKEYKNIYKVKVIELNGSIKYKDTYLYLNIDKKWELKYGNKVKIKGKYNEPEVARNYGGFNYKKYLMTLEIYGTINESNVQILEEKGLMNIDILLNEIRQNIKQKAKEFLSNETYPIYLGLVLGDTSKIDDSIKEQFRNSNMSHILAVSGMHISYIVIGTSIVLNRLIGRRKSKFITIFVLLIYMLITGGSPSIVRASVMGIMILIGGLIYRKSDTWTSIAVSLFIILIYNPYLITNIGLQFSYAGTIGIILLNRNVLKLLNKGKENKSKIKEIIAISISAQMFILPLMLIHFNTLGVYFIITNVILSIVIGPTIIIGFAFLIILIFNLKISAIIAIPLNLLIQLILLISNLAFLPFSKIYFRTPKLYEMIIFYIMVILFNSIYSVKKKKTPNATNLRVIYMIQVFKYNFRKYKSTCVKIIVGFCFLILIFIIFVPKSLKIHFVDVGQGDCCFIETPNNKTILIDGGGSEFGSFDVGRNTLLPYVLDRGYTKIDYVFISHFDKDHVGGILSIMEELKVEVVVISEQGKVSENYEKFMGIVKEKRIKVVIVGKGDRVKIEKDLYFDMLWPNSSNLIGENILNNNSIVAKLNYKNFSMLFTGDIEEIAEKQILQEYKNNLETFKSIILKVGHHGSKTSSTNELLEVVKPQIALIGVGKNNNFGHPNEGVLERLENCGAKIYRTDQMGEITIIIDCNGRINLNKFIRKEK